MKVYTFKNELLKSCSYLVVNDQRGILIDCGDIKPILEFISQNKVTLCGVILTHCHYDHIYGLPSLLGKFTELSVYCSKQTAAGLKDEMKNLSYILDNNPFCFRDNVNIKIINENGYCLDVFEVNAIETLGHSDDCFCFVIGNNIFTGDAYIPFAKVFTKWPQSNKQLAINNEQRIKNFVEVNKYNVYPGHWKE